MATVTLNTPKPQNPTNYCVSEEKIVIFSLLRGFQAKPVSSFSSSSSDASFAEGLVSSRCLTAEIIAKQVGQQVSGWEFPMLCDMMPDPKLKPLVPFLSEKSVWLGVVGSKINQSLKNSRAQKSKF